ncbi:HlyD family efflux transporter periplasmic adaptor subunit [Actinoplanes sp. TFC3]|uniref:HlyD family efflux transporter periplasmic adaptor subunit n=1 Tax=Actinoplanes sp. TFC3 TaxID=1710355 RepID=UPI000834261C|nr:HlyD family efflux transporter periplasmic adaptor subunit [Actinoplanes sp. TFC3]
MVLPTTTTSPEDADPIEAPRAPKPPGNRWRKWRARFTVLLLLAGAALLFWLIRNDRADDASRLDLGTVTLTAQPVPVEVAQAGRVSVVSVTAQQQVRAGQQLGTVEVATTDSDGDPKITKVTVSAPRAGTVVDLPVTVGSTIGPGQPFVELYDPAQLRFEAQVKLADLPEIGTSMDARLEAEGITRKVHAVVQRIVPRVGDPALLANTGADPDEMTVVLVPASADDVRGLVPGMRFTGYVELLTGKPGSPRLVSMGGI